MSVRIVPELGLRTFYTLGRRNWGASLSEGLFALSIVEEPILSQYRKDTRVSIEDFASTIKEWIDQQPKGFRLNFFVDEVGQSIADNVKLMTNLQTIAESLNTKCKGQAWIIVTSQQDMEAIVGDTKTFHSQDFSKIMARFSIRMPLDSQNVAEVIQRRLLSKTPEAAVTLGNLHDREENNLKTLFDFVDGSIKLKNYTDRAQFISSYPFPPYQFTLFQMAIRSLSQHNAFEGKHSSVGERSMLGVFQEVSKKLMNDKVGGLATFDLMFEGIRTALKSNVQQSIHLAERQVADLDAFAVRVLKALFLVKYVKEFKPSVRNISILLLSEFDADQALQRRRIEEALSLLERNTLIQRNGEVYEFLTDEEKDVEAEIKTLDIDPSELTKELETIAFDTILRHRRLRHLATNNDYAFTRKLDDHSVGRDYELAINIISPFGEDAGSPEAVRMKTMSREELAVVMKADANFVRDLILFKQTDKFIRQSRSGSPQPGRDRIVSEKGEQNARRAKDLEMRLRKLMGEARLFVRGDELDIGGEEPQDRIIKAFQSLVDKVYTNLPMLRGVSYTEADINKAVQAESSLFGSEGTGLGEAEQDVLSFINAQARNGVKVEAKPDICVLSDVAFTEAEMQDVAAVVGKDLFTADLRETLGQFEQAKNFGSLIVPKLRDPAETLRVVEARDFGGDLLLKEVQERVVAVLRMAEALSPKYHVVVANPPYMGGKGMNGKLQEFAKMRYADSKSDLFAMFMDRAIILNVKYGMTAMINMQSWMFLSSFEKLRSNILSKSSIISMAHLGDRAFDSIGGAVVSTTAFVLGKGQVSEYQGTFLNLADGRSEAAKQSDFREAIRDPRSPIRFRISTDEFSKIPGTPIVYWISENLRKAFKSLQPLSSAYTARQGLATAEDDTFLRQWFEVATGRSSVFTSPEDARWFPFTKGGEWRKWYGNNFLFVDWEDNGRRLKAFERSVIRNEDTYFSKHLTWSLIGGGLPAFRAGDTSFVFGHKGPALIETGAKPIENLLCILNSRARHRKPREDPWQGPRG